MKIAVYVAVFASCCGVSLDNSNEFCGVSQPGGTLGSRGGAGPEADKHLKDRESVMRQST